MRLTLLSPFERALRLSAQCELHKVKARRFAAPGFVAMAGSLAVQVEGFILLLFDKLAFAIVMIVVAMLGMIIVVEFLIMMELVPVKGVAIVMHAIIMVEFVMVVEAFHIVLKVFFASDETTVARKSAMSAEPAASATTKTTTEAAPTTEVFGIFNNWS
ncbi:hypothetical protein [uncultured Erythrobacter sp.]|uniref:hypothetical protein n=1 Tax=uncultured Erythrobacter sp. TaxID=263913 RepID=UPI002616D4E5|nr:hypothetical protein [uncultured Erythrobacter sp.]